MLGSPTTNRALQRRIGSAKALLRQRVVQTLPVAPLAQRLARILAQQLHQARCPRTHHRKALGPCGVLGLGCVALEVLLDRVARGTQAQRNLTDAELVYPMPASDLA